MAFLKSVKASIMGKDFQFVMKKLQVMILLLLILLLMLLLLLLKRLQDVDTAEWTARDVDVLLSEGRRVRCAGV